MATIIVGIEYLESQFDWKALCMKLWLIVYIESHAGGTKVDDEVVNDRDFVLNNLSDPYYVTQSAWTF